jgi:geranylgeranyl diphosphate synthase type II
MAIANSNKSQKEKILELYSSKENSSEDKINKITSLFIETKAEKFSLKLVDQYTQKAIKLINCLSFNQTKKNDFINFSNSLMKRDL